MRLKISKYCAAIGNDPLLVQGAGGNVSWKDGETLWVKASGTWLADATSKEIFVPVALPFLRATMARGNFDVTPAPLAGSKLRPSIEAAVHALLPHKVVVHVHAVEILAHLVRPNPEKAIMERIGGALEWGLVKYCKPGADLAKAVNTALATAPAPNAIFLQSHGIVVGGDDVDEADRTLRTLISHLATPERASVAGAISDAEIHAVELHGYRRIPLPKVQHLAVDKTYFGRLRCCWALYPDHVVFLGALPAVFDDAQSFARFLRQFGQRPELIFIKGTGVFEREKLNPAKYAYLQCYYDIMCRQSEDTPLTVLKDDEIAELLNWDAERFRQGSSAKPINSAKVLYTSRV